MAKHITNEKGGKTAGRESPKTRRARQTVHEKPSDGDDSSPDQRFPIVGIGASAGGFDALKRLLHSFRENPGVALVIILHLDPTRKSLAPELLGKYTNMRVCEVDDDPRVELNRIYVIPPTST